MQVARDAGALARPGVMPGSYTCTIDVEAAGAKAPWFTWLATPPRGYISPTQSIVLGVSRDLGRDEDSGRARRDGEGIGGIVEARGLHHRIGVDRVGLDRMQGEAVGAGDGDALLRSCWR